MRITFERDDSTAMDLAMQGALANAATSAVAIIPADYLRHECGASFDVRVAEVLQEGLVVERDCLGLNPPPFEAAFFGWEDIDEVHIY